MRIHLVSDHASPLAVLGGADAGGQNVHVAELARNLAALGAQVVVHTRRDDPALVRRTALCEGAEVDHIDAGPPVPLPKDALLPHMPAFASELHTRWLGEPPDVIHTHFWMSALAALPAAATVGIPVAHTFHALGWEKRHHQGAGDTSPPQRLYLERVIARTVDRVIATSRSEVESLRTMGMPTGRAVVVPCGVDLERFNPVGPAEPRDRTRRRVVVVSRLVERKGIGNVIAAVASLPRVELVVAGGPPSGLLDDDSEARRFRRLARDLGVEDRVTLLGGQPRERIPALLRSADVVACCPWYEPFGMVAVEAMACGVPVVASRVGGLCETVVHGVTGLHVPPRSPDRIAEALGALLDDEVMRRSMAREARRRARRFSWPHVALQTLDVFSELTRYRAGRRARARLQPR